MDSQGKIQSVERAIAILNCFQGHSALGVTEISNHVGLNKSTTFGIIRTLAAHQFLQQCQDSGKYQLGIALLRLGSLVDVDLRRMCQPYIAQLADQIGETINLVVQRGCNVVYIEKKESPHSVRICTSIGQELPMYCTATGKAILAFLSPEQREAALAEMHFQPYTAQTIADRETLLKALEEVHETRYAIDSEEFENGLICVAVPILDSAGSPTAAISCSGPKQRMDDLSIQSALDALFAAADQIGALLP